VPSAPAFRTFLGNVPTITLHGRDGTPCRPSPSHSHARPIFFVHRFSSALLHPSHFATRPLGVTFPQGFSPPQSISG
jgi:hypothetical protein